MSKLETIHTDAAPAAIGPYSQAVRTGSLVYCSGQIPLDPDTMEIVSGGIEAQTRQVFANLAAVAEAAGPGLGKAVKLTIFLTDLNDFATVNEIMAESMAEPFPARATVQVSALPKGALVEVEAVLAD
jgi:reactive intermediate/imine deaminase